MRLTWQIYLPWVGLVPQLCGRSLSATQGETPFLRGEHARLEKAAMKDLRYDFDESELSIDFERHPCGLQVLLEKHNG